MSQHQPSVEASSSQAAVAHLRIESRPQRVIVAHYDRLPFPNLGPTQEIAFDLGLTAMQSDITLTGLVFKGYSGHQMLFEQRWPARVIAQRTGQADLTIPAQTGLAVRSNYFMLQGYELLSMVEVTAVGKFMDDGQTTQALLQIPVEGHPSQTDLHFPLAGTWWAIQGSDWSDAHKQEVFSQTYALDFVRLGPDNHFFATDGLTLEDHYSWEQPVYATAGGKVAYVCYDMPDMTPGAQPDRRILRDDMRRVLGNGVAISHANGEFSYYAHLQQASLHVNEGQMIKRGALLGRVGNSGYSPGPHLHFHLMEGPNIFIDRGLPVKFSHFWAGGQYFEQPTFIPSRLILSGPDRAPAQPAAKEDRV